MKTLSGKRFFAVGALFPLTVITALLLASCAVPVPAREPDAPASTPSAAAQPALQPTQPADTAEPEPPAASPVAAPDGFRDYVDSAAGVMISIPESWVVTGIRAGEYAILQSYAEDKYIGGEAREPGDTKCDLNLKADLGGPQDLKAGWEESPIATVLTEETLTLSSGQTAYRFEIDSMGRANVLLTGIEGRWVLFTCFGEMQVFETVAGTLRGAGSPD